MALGAFFMIEAVDLFCGAAGLTAGLRKAKIKVKAGYDIVLVKPKWTRLIDNFHTQLGSCHQ